MKLSPLDIQHMEFQRGANGYHRRQVREFLERVAHEVEELLVEMEEQRAELDRRAETIAALQTAEAELQRSILAAERIGNDIKLNARKEAELIIQEAQNLTTGRLQAADGQLRAARRQMARLEREHALFRDQFRGMLDAYSRSLDNEPRLGDTLGSSGDTRLTNDPGEDEEEKLAADAPTDEAAVADEAGNPAPYDASQSVPTATAQAATGQEVTGDAVTPRKPIVPLGPRRETASEAEARTRDGGSSADVGDPSVPT